MKCPYCSFEESKVIDSRSADDGERIRRRRECLKCGKRFTTHEVIETVPIIVVKRDKSREVFDRNKLTAGILRACEKRPVSLTQIEEMVDRIEAKIQSMLDREITTRQIGELAMEELKTVDGVGLPPVQGHQHLPRGAQQAAHRETVILFKEQRPPDRAAFLVVEMKNKNRSEATLNFPFSIFNYQENFFA